jgi:hypothetical protein
MTRTFTQLLALALLITSLNACVKSTDEQLTITKDNVAATYTLVSMKASTPGLAEKDVTNENFEPCEIDDQIVLKSNYTASYIDAGMQCSSNGSSAGYWDLSDNIITIMGYDYIIRKLTRSSLVIEQTVNAGLVVTQTYTYKRY